MPPTWTCCQIGAREHYAIPRALLAEGIPVHLITDFWAVSKIRKWLPQRLAQRNHSAIPHGWVTSQNKTFLTRSLYHRFQRKSAWEAIIQDDQWFQKSVSKRLKNLHQNQKNNQIVFAYSYAARDIFQAARSLGLPCILGQIDPGPVEMRLVQALESKHGNKGQWPPDQYWANWKDECDLATKILVNSEWSKQALISEGIPEEKITVVPLAYENRNSVEQRQQHPTEYNRHRPLKVLFLGQVLIRKGIKELAAAAAKMADCPVEWHIVGRGPQVLLDELEAVPNVVVHGSVSREECVEHYLNTDVFVLPTHSDGFAITQLEAFSYGLPVIASRFCGNVVDHLQNGIILDEVTGDAIVAAIQSLLESPELLTQFRSSLMESQPDFSISRLGKTLATLGEELTNQTETASSD